MGLAAGRRNEGVREGAEANLGLVGRLEGGLLNLREAAEGGSPHGSEDLRLVAEVPVRGHGAAAELTRNDAEGHALVAVLGEELAGDFAEPLAKRFDLGSGELRTRHDGNDYIVNFTLSSQPE